MDLHSSPLVPQPCPTARVGAGTSGGLGVHEITQITRVEFLHRALSNDLPEEVVKDILAGHRASTSRQYQSSWKKFQTFLKESETQEITKEVFLQFASFMFHKLKLAIPTIMTHLAAIADPLKFAFNIAPDTRALDLLKSSFFLQRPPKKKASPSWSLIKVLELLSSEAYTLNPSPEHLFKKAIFLISLASGFRISELAALTRSKLLTRFSPDKAFVILSTNPKFIAKKRTFESQNETNEDSRSQSTR